MAVGEEEQAFVTDEVVHARKGFVEDDDGGVANGGAEEEEHALGGEGDFAEDGGGGPIQRRSVWLSIIFASMERIQLGLEPC